MTTQINIKNRKPKTKQQRKPKTHSFKVFHKNATNLALEKQNALLRQQMTFRRMNRNPTIIQNHQSISQFLPITQQLASLIKNPIHSKYPKPFTDANTQASFLLQDYMSHIGGFTVLTDFPEVTTEFPQAHGVFLYFTYGPTAWNYEYGTGPSVERAYRMWTIPLSSTDTPILNWTGTKYIPQYFTTTNYTTIRELCAAMRMVSAGFRVNSLVEVSTDSSIQFVQRFIPGQMRLVDWERWLDQNVLTPTSIDPYILSNPLRDTYANHQGGASRYNPFQQTWAQTMYWEHDALSSNSDEQSLNSHMLYYPYIYIKFNIGVEVSTLSETSISLPNNKNDLAFAAQVKSGKTGQLKQKLLEKYNADQSENKSESFHELDDDDVVFTTKTVTVATIKNKHGKSQNLIIKEQIDGKSSVTDTPWIRKYVFDFLSLEIKIWIEGLLNQPTALISWPSPSDMLWEKFVWWMSSRSNFPLVSDGNSFNGVIKKAGKFAKKNFNPRGLNKAVRYSVGMIGASKKGMTDIQTALMR